MSKVFLMLAALALAPALVLAQATPPPGTASPPPHHRGQGMQAMHHMMQQQMTLHRQFRAKVLSALSSSHRSLLESIVGQLMISSNPDPRTAVRKLDAALSPSERTAIISARNSFISQERSFRTQAMAQFRRNHPNMPSPPPRTPRALPSPDAGRILLMAAFAPRMGMMGMRRMGMHRMGMRWMHHPEGMHSPMPSPAPTM